MSIDKTFGFVKMIFSSKADALFAQSSFSLVRENYTGIAGSLLSLLRAAKFNLLRGLRIPKQLVAFGTDKRSINDIVQTQGIQHEQFECETADGYLL